MMTPTALHAFIRRQPVPTTDAECDELARSILRTAGGLRYVTPAMVRDIPERVLDVIATIAEQRVRSALRRYLVVAPGCAVPTLRLTPLRDLVRGERDGEVYGAAAERIGYKTKIAYPEARGGPVVVVGWRLRAAGRPPEDWAEWWRTCPARRPGPQLSAFRRAALQRFGCFPDWRADDWRAVLR